MSLLIVGTMLLGPPLLLGVVGGLLARRRPVLRAGTAWLIGLWAIWFVFDRVVPTGVFTDVWQFRVASLSAVFCASGLGISILIRLSRPRPSPPAA